MAATNTSAPGAFAFAGNGADRPLHQDRQILRAGDLALEQATQDAMLARARRYLHGWGVVAGFIPQVSASNNLTIHPGYGVTPLGDELFLPEPVSLPQAAEVAVLCCGPGPTGCEVIDPDALARAREDAAKITLTAWLIARPAGRDAALRPGVPEGCAHPAATLLPSRRCGGVEFAILCELPDSHQPNRPDCNDVMPFVCSLRGTETTPLPWEVLPGSEANFLVIARLTVTRGTLSADIDRRRTLWPVALIQDWIASCLCPIVVQREPTEGGRLPVGNPGPLPASPIGGGTQPGSGPTLLSRDGVIMPAGVDTNRPGRLVEPAPAPGETAGRYDPPGPAVTDSDR
jgi:hypothetical protein